MQLRIQSINSIASAMIPNSRTLLVNCDMTESQMRDAMMEFCGSITNETWQKWVKEVGDIEDEPCWNDLLVALEQIAAYDKQYPGEAPHPGLCSYGCDAPHIAQAAISKAAIAKATGEA